MPLSPHVPARRARVHRSLPGLIVIRLVARIPVRVTLAALIFSVLLLPGAVPTFGKGWWRGWPPVSTRPRRPRGRWAPRR
jgi:hypothetical protein